MRRILFLMCLVFSLNVNAEYKILIKDSGFVFPDFGIVDEDFGGDDLYSDALYYFKMDEIRNSQFKNEVTGDWVGIVGSANIVSDSTSIKAARFVSSGNDAVFSFPLSDESLSNSYSIALKYKIISSQSYLHLLTNVLGQNYGTFKITPMNGNYSLYVYSSISGSLISNFKLPVGEWVNIVFVFDKELGEARFYVNDSFSVVPLGRFSYGGMSRAYLGFESGRKGEVVVDEYAIFERVLTEEEINSL